MTGRQQILPSLYPLASPTKKTKGKKKPYLWIPGEAPPTLGRHSLAKHQVLCEYLQKYVSILTRRLAQDRLKLTLVDGFSGGGVYLHPDTNERTPGSPLIMLEAMGRAETAAIDRRERKQFFLDVEYVFIDSCRHAMDYLQAELDNSELGRAAGAQAQLLPGRFSDHLESVLQRVEQRGRSRRVIFVLDQYGYSDVRMADIRKILGRLPNAEIILTVAIDWLIDHWTEKGNFGQVLRNMEIDLGSRWASQLKESNPYDWKTLIQHALHGEFRRTSNAAYYTPFFIHSAESHRAYWLLHFSGHSKARDAMTELHWELENHFQHFGAAGFGMLGYDPRIPTCEQIQQSLPFGFDDSSLALTKEALLCQLPGRLPNEGISFQRFFECVVNETPATKKILAQVASDLSADLELEIRTKEGKLRGRGVKIDDDDILWRPRQSIWLPARGD